MKSLSIVCLLMVIISCTKTKPSNELNGFYIGPKGSTMVINDDKIEYYINVGECIVETYSGYGDFKISDSLINIRLNLHRLPIQICPIPLDNSETSEFENSGISTFNPDIKGLRIWLYKDNKIVRYLRTDKLGLCKIPQSTLINCDSILLQMPNYRNRFIAIDKKRPTRYIFVSWYSMGVKEQVRLITDSGKGLPFKYMKDSIMIKYEDYDCGKKTFNWRVFQRKK